MSVICFSANKHSPRSPVRYTQSDKWDSFSVIIVDNGITAVGAVTIHKMIRRSDGMMNIIFDSEFIPQLSCRQPDQRRGHGFHLLFQVLGVLLRGQYVLFLPSHKTLPSTRSSLYSSRAFPPSPSTCVISSSPVQLFPPSHPDNHLSPASLQLLPALLTSPAVPSLQSLRIGRTFPPTPF